MVPTMVPRVGSIATGELPASRGACASETPTRGPAASSDPRASSLPSPGGCPQPDRRDRPPARTARAHRLRPRAPGDRPADGGPPRAEPGPRPGAWSPGPTKEETMPLALLVRLGVPGRAALGLGLALLAGPA